MIYSLNQALEELALLQMLYGDEPGLRSSLIRARRAIQNAITIRQLDVSINVRKDAQD
jgi:hypothetical protein